MKVDNFFAPLKPYFDRIKLDQLDAADHQVFQLIIDYLPILFRRERQITLVGQFNAGKSTLLNAMIGEHLLPTGILPTTGVVTKLSFSRRPEMLVTHGRQTTIISNTTITMEKIAKYIHLQDQKENKASVTEIELGLPLEFLRGDCLLVDTPGLSDQAALTQATLAELRRSDMAVLIFTRKSIGKEERKIIEIVGDEMGGNIVFVFNRNERLQADPDEVQEVIENSRREIMHLNGNFLDRDMTLFCIDAQGALNARVQKQNGLGLTELADFEAWLKKLFQTTTGDQLVLNGRLSNLQLLITNAKMHFTSQKEQKRGIVDKLVKADNEQHQMQVEQWGDQVEQVKMDVAQVRNELSQKKQRLLQAINQNISEALKREKWDEHLAGCFDAPITEYAHDVQEAARKAIHSLGLTVKPFQPAYSVDIKLDDNAYATIGTVAGGALGFLFGGVGAGVGAAIGHGIGKSLGDDSRKQEAKSKCEKIAQDIANKIENQAYGYLNIDEALNRHRELNPPSPFMSEERKAAIKAVEYSETWLSWSQELLKAINKLMARSV